VSIWWRGCFGRPAQFSRGLVGMSTVHNEERVVKAG
jgi:hypothetical protein